MLVVVGLPAFFIELGVGQYARVGANKVFGRMVPAFKGLGYGMLLVRFYVNIYYVIVCAWAFFYLFVGFTSNLPWKNCGNNKTNTIGCYSIREIEACNAGNLTMNMTYYDSRCMTYPEFCSKFDMTYLGDGGEEICTKGNVSLAFSSLYMRVGPAEDYFNRVALGLTYNYAGDQYTWQVCTSLTSLELSSFSQDFGGMQWELVGCLVLTWLLVVLSLYKGVSSLGKVAYVITLAPYFVLTALLIYAAQREVSQESHLQSVLSAF